MKTTSEVIEDYCILAITLTILSLNALALVFLHLFLSW
jgi:hypothetical protein